MMDDAVSMCLDEDAGVDIEVTETCAFAMVVAGALFEDDLAGAAEVAGCVVLLSIVGDADLVLSPVIVVYPAVAPVKVADMVT